MAALKYFWPVLKVLRKHTLQLTFSKTRWFIFCRTCTRRKVNTCKFKSTREWLNPPVWQPCTRGLPFRQTHNFWTDKHSTRIICNFPQQPRQVNEEHFFCVFRASLVLKLRQGWTLVLFWTVVTHPPAAPSRLSGLTSRMSVTCLSLLRSGLWELRTPRQVSNKVYARFISCVCQCELSSKKLWQWQVVEMLRGFRWVWATTFLIA